MAYFNLHWSFQVGLFFTFQDPSFASKALFNQKTCFDIDSNLFDRIFPCSMRWLVSMHFTILFPLMKHFIMIHFADTNKEKHLKLTTLVYKGGSTFVERDQGTPHFENAYGIYI